jgi:hypothetical protein
MKEMELREFSSTYVSTTKELNDDDEQVTFMS